jgi:integrase
MGGSTPEAALWAALPDWLKPLVTTALHTGCWRGELLRLRWEDVDVNTGTIHIRRDKAGAGRWVAVNPQTLDALVTIRRERKILAPLVFTTPQGLSLQTNWKRAVRSARLSGFRFHDLRHTIASRLAQAGVSPYIIHAAGGWRSARMMQRYAHLDPGTIRAELGRLATRYPAGRGTNGGTNGHQSGHHMPSAAPSEAQETTACV